MPAYNFKDQFVPLIQSGAKLTTIRQPRKQRLTRVGDRLFLFNRMRQSRCRLIKDTICISIKPIAIYTTDSSGMVDLDGVRLSPKQIEVLAHADGFAELGDFLLFFYENYGPSFEGELIEWHP